VAQWHRIHKRNRRSSVRLSPGYKALRTYTLYAMLLTVSAFAFVVYIVIKN
jgi:hypothetical protein